jgi:DNA-3-methyladenine glycosylase II
MLHTVEVERDARAGAESASPRGTFAITPRGAFSLAAARHFLQGFTPLQGTVPEGEDRLRCAFGLEGAGPAVAVSLRQTEGGEVLGDVVGTEDIEAVKGQVARFLSLDVDGAGYDALGERDEVIGRLQRQRPGFRPVCFYSPWDAAVQAILGQRISIEQSARMRRRISEQHGQRVTIDGRTLAVFPSPSALLRVRAVAGVPELKLSRLHSLAEAALEGRLDAGPLRSMPVEEALERLQTLPGIGPWSASHILFRGAALSDALPLAEPRVLAAASIAYGRALSEAELTRMAEAWRPYRMWVSVLLVFTHGFSPAARTMRARAMRGRNGRVIA